LHRLIYYELVLSLVDMGSPTHTLMPSHVHLMGENRYL